uniref:Uncharacterized protein n=1 Tax=Mus musculus TaxID=10090 RepID=Q3V241_MOUSE|nr:unnamed protein product [Mus musculus]
MCGHLKQTILSCGCGHSSLFIFWCQSWNPHSCLQNVSGKRAGACSPLRFLEIQFPTGPSWACMDLDGWSSHHTSLSCLCHGGPGPSGLPLNVRQNNYMVISSFLVFLLLPSLFFYLKMKHSVY